MKIVLKLILCLGLLGSCAFANEERTLEATNALQLIMRKQSNVIPVELISQASAILVFPGVTRVGFFVGGLFGNGVMSIRGAGGWEAPLHVNLSGGSLGFQFGVERSDVVLFVMKYEVAEAIRARKITLGADVSAAAGPVGASLSHMRDFTFNRDIYAYASNSGLFAGVSLGGSVIGMDGQSRTPADSFAARSFIETLNQLQRR